MTHKHVDPYDSSWRGYVTTAMAHYYDMVENGTPEEYLRAHRERWADMANGGDGNVSGWMFDDDHLGAESTYRDSQFPDRATWPDEFFKEVCILMGWREY